MKVPSQLIVRLLAVLNAFASVFLICLSNLSLLAKEYSVVVSRNFD
jgi:hypothetical protein